MHISNNANRVVNQTATRRIDGALAANGGAPLTAEAELRNAAVALGEAQAFVHVAGYSFGLAFAKLKWLLQDERWRECGFDTIEAFAGSIQFDRSMKAAAEQRKELVVLFKNADANKPLSNRKIAKALNVDEGTIRRDGAENSAPASKTTSDNTEPKKVSAENSALALPSGERAARQVVNQTESREDKRERRDARERGLAGKILALPDEKYGVIYADPEWRFEVWSRETGMDRSADNHYQTSELADILKRDVASIAADDCVLFLWSTVPFEADAHAVIEAWGFEYVSQVAWRKPRQGTGFWFINVHEVLLVAKRGDVPAPAPGTQWLSVIDAPMGEHSEKPEIFYELIEAYFPNVPKIELNARRQREGWDAWGFEAPPDEDVPRASP